MNIRLLLQNKKGMGEITFLLICLSPLFFLSFLAENRNGRLSGYLAEKWILSIVTLWVFVWSFGWGYFVIKNSSLWRHTLIATIYGIFHSIGIGVIFAGLFLQIFHTELGEAVIKGILLKSYSRLIILFVSLFMLTWLLMVFVLSFIDTPRGNKRRQEPR